MKKFLLYYWLLIFVIIVTGPGTAHANDGCGFDQFHSHMMATDPAYIAKQQQLEQIIQQYLQGNPNARITPGGCEKPLDIEVTLPVVVHIVNTSAGSPLIPVSQVDSAMARINRDFRNVAGFGPDTKMRFALAKRDPNGNATTGINYVNGGTIPLYSTLGVTIDATPGASFNSIINLIQWDQSRYINVYVINTFISTLNYGGIFVNGNLMVKSIFFSENNVTFAHEMGHFFNLLHTYEGATTTTCQINNDCTIDGDQVCDTPPIKLGDITSSTCYNDDISNTSYNIMGTGQINRRFTAGQKDRMRAALYTNRWSLVLSEVLIPVTTTNEASIDAIENAPFDPINNIETEQFCGNSFVPRVTLRNIGTNNLSNCKIQVYIDGVLKTTTNLTTINLARNSSREFSLNTTPITAGIHTVRCVVSEVNGSANDYFSMNNAVCGYILFKKTQYTVSLNNSSQGTITGEGQYGCGSLVTINGTPHAGYEFDYWLDYENNTVVSTVATYSFTAERDRILFGFFKPVTVSSQIVVTVNNSNYGSTGTSGGTTNGSVYTVQASPNTGYEFLHWIENGVIVSTSATYSFTVSGNRNLVAHFGPRVYTITAGPENTTQGVVSINGTSTYGSSITVRAIRNSGYQFLHWTENGVIVSTDSIYVFTVTGNRTLVAHFTQITTGIIPDRVQTVQIYPNPATDWVTIQNLPQGTITLSGIDGTYHQIPWQERIDVSLLPTGMYIITIVSGDDTYVGKFIKR